MEEWQKRWTPKSDKWFRYNCSHCGFLRGGDKNNNPCPVWNFADFSCDKAKKISWLDEYGGCAMWALGSYE